MQGSSFILTSSAHTAYALCLLGGALPQQNPASCVGNFGRHFASRLFEFAAILQRLLVCGIMYSTREHAVQACPGIEQGCLPTNDVMVQVAITA
jgi:hypothetical protein